MNNTPQNKIIQQTTVFCNASSAAAVATPLASPAQFSRRRALSAFGASLAGLGTLSGCGEARSSSPIATGDGSCVLIPSETEGPYPLSVVLSNSTYVRGKINEEKTGVPLTLKFKLVDINHGCEPFPYASFYVWHCDKDGLYSGYAQSGSDTRGATFCRGIQDVNVKGEVTFHTIFPGWYAGRMTHIHFQVFLYNDTVSVATATSQLAFPAETTDAVYNSSLYRNRGPNNSVSSIAQDSIFADGTDSQMVNVSGSVEDGFTATLTVGIAAP
ncbi:peptidase associated/transthyretin-like domain-containing protein [Gilvimarinus japonicus]|uniref:Protocatechuate dioxygenase n=1 Tax=Gilvimarinus japonicus TaxID=1796469 RepID=A0ABV7HVU5_9GAMM